jgi:hypothetical protein
MQVVPQGGVQRAGFTMSRAWLQHIILVLPVPSKAPVPRSKDMLYSQCTLCVWVLYTQVLLSVWIDDNRPRLIKQ